MKSTLTYIFFLLFAFGIHIVYGQPGSGSIMIGKIYNKDSISGKIDSTTFFVKFNKQDIDSKIREASSLHIPWEDSTIIDTNYFKLSHIIGFPASYIWFEHGIGTNTLLIRYKGKTMFIKLEGVNYYTDYFISSIPFQSG